MRPGLLRAFLIGGVDSGALAVGEIPVTARIQPPGFPTITSALLNAMHYQYVDSVLPALLGLVLVAAVAGLLIAKSVSGNGVARLGASALAALPLLFGCVDSGEPGSTEPVPHDVVFGRPGNIDGRFDYPRAIALDVERARIYVIDKTDMAYRRASQVDSNNPGVNRLVSRWAPMSSMSSMSCRSISQTTCKCLRA